MLLMMRVRREFLEKEFAPFYTELSFAMKLVSTSLDCPLPVNEAISREYQTGSRDLPLMVLRSRVFVDVKARPSGGRETTPCGYHGGNI